MQQLMNYFQCPDMRITKLKRGKVYKDYDPKYEIEEKEEGS